MVGALQGRHQLDQDVVQAGFAELLQAARDLSGIGGRKVLAHGLKRCRLEGLWCTETVWAAAH